MKVRDLCKERKIPQTVVKTPLLVPSYSSRGFNAAAILEDTCQHNQDVKLLSAYDIHHELVNPKHIYTADLLFVDSGHYEKTATHNAGEPYEDDRDGTREWTIPLYTKCIKELDQGRCQFVRITYDMHEPLDDQIRRARESLEAHPKMLMDFLLKTERDAVKKKPRPFHDLKRLADCIGDLKFAHIVGFTEKELGGSYLQRVENIAEIRTAMNGAGLGETPIHVFGCLDPFGVLAYQAAGADIFDGLSWLRFAWKSGYLNYIPNAIAMNGAWRDDLEAGTRASQIGNLSEMRKLQSAARSLARNGHFGDVTDPWKHYLPSIEDLLTDAGISLEAV